MWPWAVSSFINILLTIIAMWVGITAHMWRSGDNFRNLYYEPELGRDLGPGQGREATCATLGKLFPTLDPFSFSVQGEAVRGRSRGPFCCIVSD